MPNICTGGVPLLLGGEDGGILLPLGGEGEANWPRWLKIILYMLGLFWCFDGVGIIAERFMGAIERITSSKKRIKRNGKDVTVKIWNDTVANLTLMALGSSAPEILLSLIELVISEKWNSGALGPSTIVGSAAFNLLVITAVCISALNEGEVRMIKDLSVFSVTATFSVFAYLWLLFILVAVTPDVVTVAEGVATFIFFPLLVFIAYLADRGYLHKLCSKFQKSKLVFSDDISPEDYEKMLQNMRTKYGHLPEDTHDRDALMYYEYAPPVSRAAHRVNATRAITGGKEVLGRMEKWLRGQAVATMMMTEKKTGKKGVASDALISFVSSHYAVLESEKRVTLSVKLNRYGDHKENVRVCYKTRDGTAEKGKDYEPARGTLHFGPDDSIKTIDIVIFEDKEHEPTEEFYVDLKDVKGAHFGHVKSATVVVIDCSGPGTLAFAKQEERIRESDEKVKHSVTVNRHKGAMGKVTCKYRTEDVSAKAGYDYTEASGVLEFGPGATAATLELEILPKSKYERTEQFRVILEETTGGAFFDTTTDGGEDSDILTVFIVSDPSRTQSNWESLISRINFDELQIGSLNWKDQFIEAVYVGGSRDEQAVAGCMDWVLHIVSLPWKLLFALVPPTDYAGGWLCFVSALVMIGLCTCIIGDLANLLGCAMDMKAPICAVTFVALGTSLPDTFASMVSARQDQTADNSIGNVTGSNSVNVFLGLGLPWAMGAIYWQINGATPEWQARGMEQGWLIDLPHIAADHPNGAFVVVGGNLGTSVGVFCACAVTCIAFLMFRRRYLGGEFGGDKKLCYASSAFLVLLWMVYIAMAVVSEGGISPY